MAVQVSSRVEVVTWSSGEDPFTRDQMNDSHSKIEQRVATFLKGTFASRPSASAATDRMFYLATDSGIVYYSNASNWFALNQFATPVAQAPGDSNTEGAATTLARSDHKHELPAWGSAIQSVATNGATSSAGSTGEFARVDHVHALGANAVTAGKIATGGISASSQFAAGVVDSTAIAADSITRSKIAVTERIPVGSMMQFGGSSAPSGWLFCQGQVLSQAAYSDLYSVVGAIYNVGGEGAGNFRLPDLRGRVPVGAGTGAGLTARNLGGRAGFETVTLSWNEMPYHNHGASHGHTASSGAVGEHTHGIPSYTNTGSGGNPYGIGQLAPIANFAYTTAGAGSHNHSITVDTAWFDTTHAGSSWGHENMQPFLVLNYIIKH